MYKYFKSPLIRITIIFLIWRLFLSSVLLIGAKFIPLGNTDRFLGGGAQNYNVAPEFFAWANFDGEHYIAIANHGYKPLEQAFFPVYPYLIKALSNLFIYDVSSLQVYTILAGFLISNISFLLALFFLWKLINLDFSESVAYTTIYVLVTFPTSFYFGAVYGESLFLLLSVASFYYARKNNFFIAGLSGMLASATRVFGILLFPVLLLSTLKRSMNPRLFFLFLIPIGLITYMVYQYLSSGDPFAFYNLQTVVGEQHQKGIILLPQVYFRYIKMLISSDMQNPIYQTIVLEFLVGITFFILPIYGIFKKINLSYCLYALIGFLLPTIQGSFSSSPRYILILFPSFVILSLVISRLPNFFKLLYFFLSTIILGLEAVLFLRGYWIA